MEIYSLNKPVQMIFCTDTTGEITPIRFRFLEREVLYTAKVLNVISKEEMSSSGTNFLCNVWLDGSMRKVRLRYSLYAHRWFMNQVYN